MDDEQYRRVYTAVARIPCPFDKAISSRVCACQNATRTNIGEREAVSCTNEDAQSQCVALLGLTRRNANFALGFKHTPSALPHAKAIQIQCGGLLGLQRALDRVEERAVVDNIHALVRRALRRFGALENIPFDQIMRTVNHYQHRQRRMRK